MASGESNRNTIFPGSGGSIGPLPGPTTGYRGKSDIPDLAQSAYVDTSISEHDLPSPSTQEGLGTIRKKRRYNIGRVIHPSALKQKQQKHEEPARRYVSVVQESPWNKYQGLYKLQFGNDKYFNTVAEEMNPEEDDPAIVLIRNLSATNIDDQIRQIQQSWHPNLVPSRDIFEYNGTFSAAYEFMPLSLKEVAANPLLDEVRLASIMGQVRSYWIVQSLIEAD